jgi:hypothetical protein
MTIRLRHTANIKRPAVLPGRVFRTAKIAAPGISNSDITPGNGARGECNFTSRIDDANAMSNQNRVRTGKRGDDLKSLTRSRSTQHSACVRILSALGNFAFALLWLRKVEQPRESHLIWSQCDQNRSSVPDPCPRSCNGPQNVRV